MRRIFDIVPYSTRDAFSPSVWSRDPFRDLGKEIEKAFGGFLAQGKNGSFAPAVDIEDNEKEYRISAELPGMKESDINISLTENVLKLTGEKKIDEEKKENGSYYRESTYGAFERVIPLETFEFDHDNVTAAMKDGVLTITLPKSERAQKKERTVSIKRG